MQNIIATSCISDITAASELHTSKRTITYIRIIATVTHSAMTASCNSLADALAPIYSAVISSFSYKVMPSSAIASAIAVTMSELRYLVSVLASSSNLDEILPNLTTSARSLPLPEVCS